jgi:hypothetical protein
MDDIQPAFSITRAFQDADRIPLEQYESLLGEHFNNELAAAAALAEAFSMQNGDSAFPMPMRRIGSYVFDDSSRISDASDLVSRLIRLGVLKRVSMGDKDTRTPSTYKFVGGR